jgi:rhombotail lipoprotein
MKRTIGLVLAAAVMVGCGGCSATHQAMVNPTADLLRCGVVNDPDQARRLEKAMTDPQIANLLDAKISAKLPTSIAVAKLRSHCSGYQPFLDPPDAEELTAWEQALAAQAMIQGIQPVSSLADTSERPTIHSLRVAAARMGCELLLVYIQSDSQVTNLNDAAVLYWTIVGLWTVPGNVLEYRTMMQALLVDSRTGAILGSATGDSHQKKEYPAAFASQRQAELSSRASKEAMTDLRTGCRRLVKQVVETALARR